MTVYVIGQPGASIVKIGYTAGVAAIRLRTLRLSSPVPLTVRASWPGARELEKRLHRRFAHARVHGEWFDFGEQDPVDEVSAVIADPAFHEDARPAAYPWHSRLDIPIPRGAVDLPSTVHLPEATRAPDREFIACLGGGACSCEAHRGDGPRRGGELGAHTEPCVRVKVPGHHTVVTRYVPLWWWEQYVNETGWDGPSLSEDETTEWHQLWSAAATGDDAVELIRRA